MSKYALDLVITAISPLHISEVGSSRWDPDQGRFTSQGGFPCTRTKRASVAMRAAGESGGGEREFNAPLVPGNSLRGAIRRCCADMLFDSWVQRDLKIPLDLYHVILCGSATASPDSKQATISDLIEAGKNPFVGLFGGGPKLARSNYSAGNAYVITKETLAAQMIPSAFADFAVDSRTLTQVAISTKVDDVIRGTSSIDVLKDPAAEIAAWMETLESSRKKRDDDDGGKKVGIATVMAKEYIIPGVSLHSDHRLDTSLAGPAMLGLYLLALRAYANRQKLGGGARAGYGRFLLNATMQNGSGGTVQVLKAIDGRYEIETGNSQVGEAVAAAEAWISNVTPADMKKGFML